MSCSRRTSLIISAKLIRKSGRGILLNAALWLRNSRFSPSLESSPVAFQLVSEFGCSHRIKFSAAAFSAEQIVLSYKATEFDSPHANFVVKDCRWLYILAAFAEHVSDCLLLPCFPLFFPPCRPQHLCLLRARIPLAPISLVWRCSGNPSGSSTIFQISLEKWSWSPIPTTRSARTRRR